MEFKLTTSDSYYENKNNVKKLMKLGFTFSIITDYSNTKYYKRTNNPTIKFNTLEELIDFVKKYGDIVLNENTIEIYDNYRE